MRICTLENGGLFGELRVESPWPYSSGGLSYNVRIWIGGPTEIEGSTLRTRHAVIVKSFGNGVAAEDFLLEMMLYPSWVLLSLK